MRFFLGRRIQLRKALRQMADAGNGPAKAALASRKVFVALFEEVDADYDRYCDENFGGPITDFFNWLLENQEAILKLIMTIISLFSEADSGFAAWAAKAAAAILVALTLGVASAGAGPHELAPPAPSYELAPATTWQKSAVRSQKSEGGGTTLARLTSDLRPPTSDLWACGPCGSPGCQADAPGQGTRAPAAGPAALRELRAEGVPVVFTNSISNQGELPCPTNPAAKAPRTSDTTTRTS